MSRLKVFEKPDDGSEKRMVRELFDHMNEVTLPLTELLTEVMLSGRVNPSKIGEFMVQNAYLNGVVDGINSEKPDTISLKTCEYLTKLRALVIPIRIILESHFRKKQDKDSNGTTSVD